MEVHGVLFFATVLRHLLSTRKRASARCAVFYNGFCTPKAPKVDAVLFFASVLNRLPLPPARLASGLCPTCVQLVSGLRPACVRLESPENFAPVWRECDLCQKRKFYMRVVTFSENPVSVTRFKGYHKRHPAKGSVDREQPDSRLSLSC